MAVGQAMALRSIPIRVDPNELCKKLDESPNTFRAVPVAEDQWGLGPAREDGESADDETQEQRVADGQRQIDEGGGPAESR